MCPQDYFILWSIYSVSAVVLLLASIFFTNFLWRIIKEPIVIIVAILLFYPILIDADKTQYAPAIAVMAIDFLMKVGKHETIIINQLVYIIEMVLVGYFIFAIFIRWPAEVAFRKWYRNRKAKQQLQVQKENSQQAMPEEEKEEFVYFKDSYKEPPLQADEKL